MKYRPDLPDAQSPEGIEVFQLACGNIPHSHVYMEAQIFTPDSKRFVFHRSAHAHGSDPDDPEHKYLLCDLENNGAIIPLTSGAGKMGPCISPDGRYFYYFEKETGQFSGKLILHRISLDNLKSEEIFVLNSPLSGFSGIPNRVYPLSTISADGQRIALTAFMGDGKTENAPWGLLVFDLEKGTVSVPLSGSEWGNMHAQYCRSTEAAASHDIMIQHDHGNVFNTDGSYKVRGTAAWDKYSNELNIYAKKQKCSSKDSFSGLGTDIHLISDDGLNFRSFPWGRDGNERCQGHQCWRGCSTFAIASTVSFNPHGEFLIEAQAISPLPGEEHSGLRMTGAERNELDGNLHEAHFDHFATDAEGGLIISDYGTFCKANQLWIGKLGIPGKEPVKWRKLLGLPGTVTKETQLHPFLSPDGKTAFFNSSESGMLQAYMITGIDKLSF